MKKKSAKKLDRKKLIKKLDNLFSLYIRKRDNYTCYTCGKKDGVMQCGHLITRSKMSTRYNEINSHCQCSGCNLLHEYQPEIYTQKFINDYGLEAYNKLVNLGHTTLKLTSNDLLIMIKFYEELL